MAVKDKIFKNRTVRHAQCFIFVAKRQKRSALLFYLFFLRNYIRLCVNKWIYGFSFIIFRFKLIKSQSYWASRLLRICNTFVAPLVNSLFQQTNSVDQVVYCLWQMNAANGAVLSLVSFTEAKKVRYLTSSTREMTECQAAIGPAIVPHCSGDRSL